MHAVSDSEPPPAITAVRRKRPELDPKRMYYTVGECARAMGVDIKTARRRLQAHDALERIGGWDYTTKSLLRRAFAKTSAALIATLEDDRSEDAR